jgi:hypothetical protein|tara:strand:+ start:803 stop:1582 length:780 start_codon:yes stop_codon:yes gene_type:complete
MAFSLKSKASGAATRSFMGASYTLTGLTASSSSTLIVVFVFTRTSATVATSFNYNINGGTYSNTLTRAGAIAQSSEGTCQLYYKLNPNFSGINDTINIQIGRAFFNSSYIAAMGSIYDTAASTTVEVAASGSGTSNGSTNPFAPSLSMIAPGIQINGLFSGRSSTSGLSANNTALSTPRDGGSFVYADQYFLTAASIAKSMSWTFASSDDWACNSLSLKEVSAGPSPTSNVDSISGTQWSRITSVNDRLTTGISEINGI